MVAGLRGGLSEQGRSGMLPARVWNGQGSWLHRDRDVNNAATGSDVPNSMIDVEFDNEGWFHDIDVVEAEGVAL